MNLQDWLRFCAWAQCRSCHVWHKRSLSQAEMRDPTRARTRLQALCWQCQTHALRAPRLDAASLPAALQGLRLADSALLQFITVSQGSAAKHPHGFRRKDKMTALWWHDTSVPDRLAQLEP
eukprot:2911875-Alexandrium_andersonii.AAC.1